MSLCSVRRDTISFSQCRVRGGTRPLFFLFCFWTSLLGLHMYEVQSTPSVSLGWADPSMGQGCKWLLPRPVQCLQSLRPG